MKKLSVFMAALVCSLVFSIGAKAQAPADYFVGKWSVLTTGLPSGDAKSVVTFERKDGKLIGTMAEEGKPSKNVFTKVEEKGTTVTGYFTAGAYDVYIFLEKKDDNNIIGSMMDMFDCTGVRIVETKTEVK
jgi:uncharacterized protein with GYD domain